MEDMFNYGTALSEADRMEGKILEGQMELEVFGEYFGDSGRYKVTIGHKGTEHTEELFKAYENTQKYWKNNQEKILDSISEIAAEQYKSIWEIKESLFETPIYAEYNEAKRHYEQLMDKKQLKTAVKIISLHIVPIISDEICYMAVCLADKTDYEIFRVPPIWITMEQNNLAAVHDAGENDEDIDTTLLYAVEEYRRGREPYIFLSMEPFERIEAPRNLGRGNELKKFKRLVPYLSNMKLDAAPRISWKYFFLPRGTHPIGEYNGMIYFLMKIKNKKWDECPVFDIDGALEMDGCMPLAENLSAFIKLAVMTHSFMELSFIARTPAEKYHRDEQRYKDWDVSEEIKVLEDNFHLPEIDDAITYISKLNRNKDYVKMGKKTLYKMFMKRGLKEEYYDAYERKDSQ